MEKSSLRVEAFRDFLARQKGAMPWQIFCHGDADGLCAGLILHEALRRLGLATNPILIPGKGENAFTGGTRSQLAQERMGALVVLDLGCEARTIVEGIPTLFLDHHQPSGVPRGGLLITSFGDPTPALSTAPLAYELCSSLVEMQDLLWVAAIGTIGDMGMDAKVLLLEAAYACYSKTSLREATVLINSASRASAHDCPAALMALEKAQDPRDISRKRLPEAQLLQTYREEVNRALEQAGWLRPRFVGKVAYIRLESPCDTSGLLATRWARRLPNYACLVANYGYLAGRVIYDIRTQAELDVLALMNALAPEGRRISYGQPRAAGGNLEVALWEEVLVRLGFGPTATQKVQEVR